MTCPTKKVKQSELSPVLQALLTRPVGAHLSSRVVLGFDDRWSLFADVTEGSLREDPGCLV